MIQMHKRLIRIAATAGALLAINGTAQAVDTEAAEALVKKSKCFICHSVDKNKVGPSFKSTAEKYKGKADAEQTLITHMKTNHKEKLDGKEETHDSPKTKNDAEIKNLVGWILSR